MHYLVTGHTGFKGAWLTLLLKSRGHEVSGISLHAVDGGIFRRAGVELELKHHVIQDIRDRDGLNSAIELISPDVVIHMAAQPLVLESYKSPVETFDTNVTGTLNLLAGCAEVESIKAIVVVTTDKVYRDDGIGEYGESSPLGGHDPYSASKAMADILAQSWRNLKPRYQLGIARAGNVIGFGDVSENRLIPDINRGLRGRKEVLVRNPDAVRPWQHVLDCLNGYTLYADALLAGLPLPTSGVLNFGPAPDSYRSVGELASLAESLAPDLKIVRTQEPADSLSKETAFLTLDSAAARGALGWADKISFDTAVAWSLDRNESHPREKVLEQLRQFELLGA